MPVIDAAVSIAEFETIGHSDAIAHTTAADISSHVDEGIRLSGPSGEYISYILPGSPHTTIHAQAYVKCSSNFGTNTLLFEFVDEAGNSYGAVRSDANSGTPKFNLTINGTEQALSAGTVNVTALKKFDFELKIADAGGYIRLLVDDVLVVEFTGDTNIIAGSGVTRMRVYNCLNNGANFTYLSGFVWGTSDIRDHTAAQLDTYAAGSANTASSGTHANFDGLGYDIADNVAFDTAGQLIRFTANLKTVHQTGYTIEGMKIGAYAKKGGVGPAKLSLGYYISATEYMDTATELTTVNAHRGRFDVQNPNTTAAWTVSDVDVNAEFELKVAA